jgi:hypothetical protein
MPSDRMISETLRVTADVLASVSKELGHQLPGLVVHFVSKGGIRGPSALLGSLERPAQAEATAYYTNLFRPGRFAVEVHAEFPTEPKLRGLTLYLRTGDVGPTSTQGYTLRW